MKQMTKKIGAICVALAIIFSSSIITGCKKDEKEPEPVVTPPPPPTNTEKLTNKNFKMTAATVDPGVFNGTATITDLYNSSLLKDCDKDNLVKFNTNGTVTEDEGGTKCNTNDPQTVTSDKWAWNTTETILSITTGTTTESFNVLVNDGTTLKMDQTVDFNGTNYKYTFTYTKQ